MRTLVVGDVHGAYKCLVEVLEKAGPADRVIFLGDYVDGLPQSFEVVEHIRQMENAVCVRGNHDQWALDWLLEHPDAIMPPGSLHFDQGGRATWLSYQNRSAEERAAHVAFLLDTEGHFVDEKGRLFVHGGITGRSLENAMIGEKIWDRTMLELAVGKRKEEDYFLTEGPFKDFPEIYVGHTAVNRYTGVMRPALFGNVWAMDTNCGWGGPLAAMDVDTKEMFYSRPSSDHYPEYQGR